MRMTGAGGEREAWVVVADADERSARRVAADLRRAGFWAYPTTCGAEAFRLARACPLALAVVDVVLRDMAGHELVTALRQWDGRLPVIMTAGAAGAEREVEARQVGIVHYARKPLDLRQLRAVATKAVAAGSDEKRERARHD